MSANPRTAYAVSVRYVVEKVVVDGDQVHTAATLAVVDTLEEARRYIPLKADTRLPGQILDPGCSGRVETWM